MVVSGSYWCDMKIVISWSPNITGIVVAMIVWQLDLQLPMHSVSITTDVVRSNLDQGELYSIQQYVIFSAGTPVSSTNKADRYDITEILLKMALSNIKQTNKPYNILI